VREHLANERTLLSWVRTDVGLVSIALVVERAGALAGDAGSAVGSEAFSLALAFLGCLTLVIGTAHFLRTRREISLGDYTPSGTAYLVVVMAGSLAIAGAFIAYVLLG
jgi:putative membrane protein